MEAQRATAAVLHEMVGNNASRSGITEGSKTGPWASHRCSALLSSRRRPLSKKRGYSLCYFLAVCWLEEPDGMGWEYRRQSIPLHQTSWERPVATAFLILPLLTPKNLFFGPPPLLLNHHSPHGSDIRSIDATSVALFVFHIQCSFCSNNQPKKLQEAFGAKRFIFLLCAMHTSVE